LTVEVTGETGGAAVSTGFVTGAVGDCEPLPVPPIFDLIRKQGGISEEEMYDVFNMGCGFCVVVPPADEEAALALLRSHYPAAQRIGRATGGPKEVRRA